MKKLLIATLFTIISGGALANTAESPSFSDERIKMLKYSDRDVYTISTKYGYQTNIVFGKGEEIQTLSVGDRSLWQLIPAGNRLFIRPMEYGMQTNMTLITNKHSYQFDLKSLADDKSSGNIYVARFIYPEDEEKKRAEKSASMMPPAALLAETALNQPGDERHVAPRPAPSRPVAQAELQPVFPPPAPNTPAATAQPHPGYNYNYTYAGADSLAPVQAYDDGKSTYIQYRADQPLPSIYMIDSSGNAKPVSYKVDSSNRIVINNMTAGEWQLEGDGGNVHLYNEMLNPE